MIELLAKKRVSRHLLKNRRQEIAYCLAACGVRSDASRQETAFTPEYMQRLRQALERLGPVFAAFGLYMASRVDLLGESNCSELATIVSQGEITPITTVQELVARELGVPYHQVFAVFADAPFVSHLFSQSHRAQLHNGTAVVVTVLHPELQDALDRDLEVLPALKRAFPGVAPSWGAMDEAMADFRRIVRWQTDLRSQLKAMEMLARDAQEFAMLQVPRLYKELCSLSILTCEEISGIPLSALIAAQEGRSREQPETRSVWDSAGLEPHALARRLCMVWLRQALLGGQFPVEWQWDDLMLLPDTRIAFTGGVFATLPVDAKKNLWHYVLATAKEDPEQACSYLVQELAEERQLSEENELRYRFREVVPFRDGRGQGDGVSSNLSGYLFVHWKLLSARGFRLQPHLLCFYRGLFRMLALTRRLSPEGDALPEGLQDVRTIVMLTQFQEMMTLQTVSNNLERYATMMMELPRKFDEALTQAYSQRLQHHGTPSAHSPRPSTTSAVVVALLLALAAVVLLSQHLVASGIAREWVEKGSAIVFVLLGALLLRAASRTR